MIENLQHILLNAGALILTLGILVTIHEFGHFWVARRCGVKVERFSIGYGKPLLRWRRGETEYVVAMLPLGGYVRMLSEPDPEAKVAPNAAQMAFSSKSLSIRTAIIAAGPVANFLLAIFLYWLMYIVGVSAVAPVVGRVESGSIAAAAGLDSNDEILAVDGRLTPTWQETRMAFLQRMGEDGSIVLRVRDTGTDASRQLALPVSKFISGERDPDPLAELGIVPFYLEIPARVGEVSPGGAAATAGFLSGDLVVSVNGELILGWRHWVEVIQGNPEQTLSVAIDRGGVPMVLDVVPARQENGTGRIGLGAQQPDVQPAMPEWMNREMRYSPVQALPQAVAETWNTSVLILSALKKMVVGLISVKNLSGPLTIAQVAGDTVSYGLEYFLGFLAMLSVTLGVMNLLPVPVLDGGHLLYNLVEFIIRRPVPEQVQQWGIQFGVLLIIGFTFIAFYNDLNRLFM